MFKDNVIKELFIENKLIFKFCLLLILVCFSIVLCLYTYTWPTTLSALFEFPMILPFLVLAFCFLPFNLKISNVFINLIPLSWTVQMFFNGAPNDVSKVSLILVTLIFFCCSIYSIFKKSFWPWLIFNIVALILPILMVSNLNVWVSIAFYFVLIILLVARIINSFSSKIDLSWHKINLLNFPWVTAIISLVVLNLNIFLLIYEVFYEQRI